MDEGFELGGLLLDGFGGAVVGADAEGVSGIDLEERGGFFEESGDGEVVHKREKSQQSRWKHRLLTQYATCGAAMHVWGLSEGAAPGYSASLMRAT